MNEVLCPHCQQTVAYNPSLAGQTVACPHCLKLFTMPLASEFEPVSKPSDRARLTPDEIAIKVLESPVRRETPGKPPGRAASQDRKTKMPRRKDNFPIQMAMVAVACGLLISVVMLCVFYEDGSGSDNSLVVPKREETSKATPQSLEGRGDQIIIPPHTDQRKVYLEHEQALLRLEKTQRYRELYGMFHRQDRYGTPTYPHEQRMSALKEMDRLDPECVMEVARRHGLTEYQIGLISLRGFDNKWPGWDLANKIDSENWTY